MAGKEIETMSDNLRDLSQSTGMAAVEFTGLTKKLIEASDSMSLSGKSWTTFSIFLMGLFLIQKKVYKLT